MSKYILSDIFKGDYPVTQRYNENPASYLMFAIPGHEGTDFGTPNGTDVLAPFDGIILRDTLNDKDYGNFTVIWDPSQCCGVWYCHLQDVTTLSGDKVKKGQVVGHTNNTGHSTGPHLHVNFVETDPSGNRLNLDNGKQGFLDLLDPNLVEWKLGTSAILAQQVAQITDQTKIPQIDGMEVQAIHSKLMDQAKTIDDLTFQNRMLQGNYDGAMAQASDLARQFNQSRDDLKRCQLSLTNALKTAATLPEEHTFNSPLFSQLFAYLGKLFGK